MVKFIPFIASAALLCACNMNLSFTNSVNVMGDCSETGIDFCEQRDVTFFDSFETSGPFNVYFVQSDTQKVIVEGKEEFVKKLKTKVSDETLSIKLEKGQYFDLVLKVTVYSPVIDEISGAGSGNIICSDISMPDKDIEFASAGSGDLFLGNVNCKEFDLATAGSGDTYMHGTISIREDLDIAIAGSGSIQIDTLLCNDLDIAIAGSGCAKIDYATIADEADLHVMGSGDITINGKCRKVDASSAGSGDIKGNLEYSLVEKHRTGSGDIRL